MASDQPRGWAGDRRWFVIVGGQRARSSMATRVLAQHPQVFLPTREVAYFEDPYHLRLRREDFLANFADAHDAVVTGFKRPEILGRPEAPARLAEAMPDARLVALLREPVERTVSAYFHYVRSAFLPMLPLNEGMRILLDGAPVPGCPHSHEVLDFSEYGASLERLLEAFPREQLLVLLDRDLDGDPQGSIERILVHLGVEPCTSLDLRSEGVNAGDYTDGLQMRVIRGASRLLYRPEPTTGLTWAQPGWARTAAAGGLARLARRFPGPKQPGLTVLEPDVRAALVERLDPDVRKLERILGRDLSDWPAR